MKQPMPEGQLRCYECGIADADVAKGKGGSWHGNVPRDCVKAALSLLKRARPYVLGASQLYKTEGGRQQACALLAQMPEEK